ncbi:Ulvan-active sulfatase (Iduronate 2-sulfatase) (Polysaccharide utilization locus H protein P11) (PUL H protein P11) (Sulfatase family S1 subfamily 7 protein P11) (P11_S1_7) [Durusdinium trenchii]|uniref:Ulvan-active sulfatase (Iduronate 2-sulfatase) (Polysaccharide utilization locus H protein P11) (PUL H protein P11) (Sulfatase family S1 subfamily 7 protein P11) (P11_S1_7) n=1 Tax=Durusdinium trenchii TaxID=1381693 RepID=A0ABP0HLJ5_9DINO
MEERDDRQRSGLGVRAARATRWAAFTDAVRGRRGRRSQWNRLATWVMLSALVVGPWLSPVQGELPVPPARKQNVLLIIVDDLKPAIGAYGDDLAKTPVMDERIAKDGFVFTNHHCQSAECAPSRASMLSGLRPTQNRIFHFEPKFRALNKKLVTLPGWFRKHGYTSVGSGKIFDATSFGPRFKEFRTTPDLCTAKKIKKGVECSWDSMPSIQQTRMSKSLPRKIAFAPKKKGKNKIVAGEGALEEMIDFAVAHGAINTLKTIEEPFFLAVGFLKPHLPFFAASSFMEDRPVSDFMTMAAQTIRSVPKEFFKKTSHTYLRSNNREFNAAVNGFKSSTPAQLIHGYYACVTQTDHLIGKVLDTLDSRPEVAYNTVVVLWGDHGYHLGDHGMWGKKTLWEQATRSPLIIKPSQAYRDANPTMLDRAEIPHPTESVDIYPTLAHMAGIGQGLPAMAGETLEPFFFRVNAGVGYEDDDDARLLSDSGGVAAISQYEPYGKKKIMGFSVRFRNTRAMMFYQLKGKEVKFGKPRLEVELYDLEADPAESIRVKDASLLAKVNDFSSKAASASWDQSSFVEAFGGAAIP